jgi:hypothetical protein
MGKLDFANHPYLCKGLDTTNELLTSRIGLITLAHTIQVLDLSKTHSVLRLALIGILLCLFPWTIKIV